MKRQWHIREAVAEDSVGLQTCMQSAYALYQERMGGARLPPMDQDYETEIRDYPTWVAVLDGEVVGGLIMMFENDHALIANIAVDPRYQGQGLGGGLIEFAELTASEKGYSRLRLATHVLLTENLSLYCHLGWSEYDRDEVRIYMEKKI
ncbi:GNAT family N-acetyltransferase [Pseudomonadota bacterium]